MLPAKTIVGLRAVSEALGINPSGFDMDSWVARTPCGTTLCIWGHFEIFMGRMPDGCWLTAAGREVCATFGGNVVTENIEAAGLDYTDWLFWLPKWPDELFNQYMFGERVRAGQLAIERFIAQRATPEDLAAAAELEKPTFAFDYGVPA